jgi:hypothetical protein
LTFLGGDESDWLELFDERLPRLCSDTILEVVLIE